MREKTDRLPKNLILSGALLCLKPVCLAAGYLDLPCLYLFRAQTPPGVGGEGVAQ